MKPLLEGPQRLSEPILSWSIVPIAALYLTQLALSLGMNSLLTGLETWQRMAGLTVLYYALIASVLWLERGRWQDFFITLDGLRASLRDGLWMTLAFIPLAWLYAQITLGKTYWLPLEEWPSTFLAALIAAALPEELIYRAFLLGIAQRWKIRQAVAIIAIGILFGPVHHNRYIWHKDFLALATVTAFGLAATYVTLKRRSIIGPLVGHTAMDFLVFLFVGGKVTVL